MRFVSSQLARVAAFALAPAALCLALAGCGGTGTTTAAAVASPTPTCPPTPTTASFKVISGKITVVNGAAITVAPNSGAAVTVQTTATTRLTKLTTTTLSAVAVGDVAQVMTDASGVTATRITVTSGAGGFGGNSQGNGSQPRATRTPGARVNTSCFRRAGQAGSPFGAAAGQRGRVTNVSTSQIVVTDAQGEALTYGVTSSTVVIAPTSATAADLVVGAAVTVTGATSGSAIVARSIIITPAGQ